MAQDAKFIREFIDELPDDDRQSLRRIFELLDAYADGLNLEDIRQIALLTSNSPVKAYGIYEEFSKEQLMERRILVCDNITCLGKGANRIKKYLSDNVELLDQLSLEVEYVKCLGSCSRGPCLFYSNKMYCELDPLDIHGVLLGLDSHDQK